MRADLHLHSYHSGYANHLAFLRARDCYSEPEAVYAVAKARGMDLVTFTDHDRIDGCLELLDRHPDARDFFISEEIECHFPDANLKVHVAAYDISERIHGEVRRLVDNVVDVAEYLRSEGVFYALNHPFFLFHGELPLHEYLRRIQELFPAVEVRNGTMLEAQNGLAQEIVNRSIATGGRVVTGIGGSDSHTLSGIGTTYTEAPGSTREEFLQSLRSGRGCAGGRHGSVWRESREIYGVVGQYWRELLGAGRRDLSWGRRAVGLAFSIVSMPFEWSPLVVAALHKRSERARMDRYEREWRDLREVSVDPTTACEEPGMTASAATEAIR